MANKKITIDNLAGMIKRSFDEVYRRLDKLDENDKIIIAKLEGSSIEKNLKN